MIKEQAKKIWSLALANKKLAIAVVVVISILIII